jgi:hypothetical protein
LLLATSTIITINGHYIIGPLFIAFAIWALNGCFKTPIPVKVQRFTLIELIAVISLMAILLTILLTIKPDYMRSDAARLNDYLMQCQTYSMDVNHIVPVEIEDKLYKNEVVLSEGMYFKKGVPVKLDESLIIGCTALIRDRQDIEKDIVIKINTFTGKRSFKYD